MRIPIIGTGLSGLVGSRLTELLADDFDFKDLSYDSGIDITNREQVAAVVQSSAGKIILHLGAKTDVEACEHDKSLGKKGPAWQINVVGTRNIVEQARLYRKKMIYISTDFVFAGSQDEYDEDDKPNPINWYGLTKYEGEKIVLAQKGNLVVRIAYPYRATNPTKPDFVHSIAQVLQKEETVTLVSDYVFTPTFIDDMVMALKFLIAKNALGIYHIVGSSSLTPYEAATQVADVFGFRKELIGKTSGKEYYQYKAPRPEKLKIKNDKLHTLGYKMLTFRQGLKEVKKQGLKL